MLDIAGVGISTGMEERGREESNVDSCSTEVEIEEVGAEKELFVRGCLVAYSRPSPSSISAAKRYRVWVREEKCRVRVRDVVAIMDM